MRKTSKLTCVVTGKVLIASHDYYQRKVEQAGSEEKLKRIYICKEVRGLLLKGYSVDKIRVMLNVQGLPDITTEHLAEIIQYYNISLLKLNNYSSDINKELYNIQTDPEVAQFINKIKQNDS